MNVVIWGTGEYLQRNIDKLRLDDVVCFVDKKADGSNDELMGKRIISPKQLLEIKFDLIVISSVKYLSEITANLITKKEVPFWRIVSLDYWLGIDDVLCKRMVFFEMSNIYQQNDHLSYELVFRNPKKISGLNTDLMLKKIGYEYLEFIDFINYNNKGDLCNIKGTIIKENSSNQIASIYVVAHKHFSRINDPLYKTIWVGNHKNGTDKDVYDNTGDEISEYNNLINECSALYWIWKNDKESDLIGLNHYRRYFGSTINTGCPIQRWEIDILLKECDIIAAKHVDFWDTNAAVLRWDIGDDPYESSVKVLNEIFEKRSVKEKKAYSVFLNDIMVFPCQMFIMDRQKLDEYCSWLFPIVFEMIDKVEIKESWSKYSKRVIGFWAERLFTVWLLFSDYKIEEVPIIKTDDEGPYGR